MKRFRLYYDKDAEQDWLNGMADRGWAFSGFFLGVYSFEKCEPGEWRYQIDLLPARTDSGPDYAAFMSDSGVEVVPLGVFAQEGGRRPVRNVHRR